MHFSYFYSTPAIKSQETNALLHVLSDEFGDEIEGRAQLIFVFTAALGRFWPSATFAAELLTDHTGKFARVQAAPGQFR